MTLQSDLQKGFWKKLVQYKTKLYQTTTLATLAAVGLFCLREAGLEGSFDNVSVILFRLFPEKFKLVSFPEHPDFIRIDNTLRLDCKHANLLTGNRVKGFLLTNHGKLVAEEALLHLRSGKPIPTTQEQRQTLSGSRRNRETRLVSEVGKSEAYQKYVSGRERELSRYEVSDALHGTLDTHSDKLKPNLYLLRQYAKDLTSLTEFRQMATSVMEFLDYVESSWERIFHD